MNSSAGRALITQIAFLPITNKVGAVRESVTSFGEFLLQFKSANTLPLFSPAKNLILR
jgi:hypothetical protein